MNPTMKPGWRTTVESWGFTVAARPDGTYRVACTRDGCDWAAYPTTAYGAAEAPAFHLMTDHPADFDRLGPNPR